MANDTIWRIVDDLSDFPVEASELDAVEAFLMAAVNAILRGEPVEPSLTPQSKPAMDPKRPQSHAQERRQRRR
jgi:hypothetical protein